MLTKIYELNPFSGGNLHYTTIPLEQIEVTQLCGPQHVGAKDLIFPGISWDFPSTPIYAIESGIIRYLRRDSVHCPDANNCPNFDNMLLIEGPDGFYTGYHHVKPLPDLQVGMSVQASQIIGNIDNSGVTSGPHLHLACYTPGDPATWWHSDRGTCDWVIKCLDYPGVC